MLSTWLRKVSKTKEFFQGASILPEHYHNVTFKNNYENVVKMFELRNWYIQNSPHSSYGAKYTNEMAYLHNELNYLNSKQLLTRTVLVSAIVFVYSVFLMEEVARDYKDNFDLKFNQKIYGSIADSSGEGASSMDDWSMNYHLFTFR